MKLTKLHAQRNYEQFDPGECMVPFSSESVIFRILSETKIKIYRTLILCVVLCGHEGKDIV